MKPRYILMLILTIFFITQQGWAATTGVCDFTIPCNPGSYLPHPCDCTLLFHCGSSNWILKKCENGTKWDQSLLSCNYDAEVEAPCDTYCTDKIGFEESATVAPSSVTKEECKTDKMIPYPTDCSRNLDYMTQIWVTWDCTNITAWNGTNEDTPANATNSTTAAPTDNEDPITTTASETDNSKIFGHEKNFFIGIVAASIGAFLLLVLILVLYICCCNRTKSEPEEPKKGILKKNSKKEFAYENGGEKTRHITTIQVD